MSHLSQNRSLGAALRRVARLKPTAAAVVAVLVLGGSAGAAALLGPNPVSLPAWGGRGADDDEAAADAPHAAHAAGHDSPLRVLKEPEGVIPTTEDALLTLDRRPRIMIRTEADWNPANGIRGGAGTPEDPYLITGYHADLVYVADTTSCFEISGNYVSDILILDWTGPCGLVHHNRVANLRTNRNVERTGDPTAAVITRNDIARVEELRHFDGVLTENVIGKKPLAEDAPLLGDVRLPANGVALNVAGLNGADISKNTVYGGVDMKLHGHHHSDANGLHSHNHGKADGDQNETRAENHSVRYVNFLFRDNVIIDDGFGLRYNDLNHAGDDRTATSEQEPTLELPHLHYTTVRISNNVIEGRGLRVSVFNAPDERHLGNVGTLVLEGNLIKEPAAGDAVIVQDVTDAAVVLSANRVEKADLKLDGGSGVLMQRFRNATVSVAGNSLPGFAIGVRARDFDANTTWAAVGNDAPDAEHAVYWDSSVANPPNGEAAADAPGADDGHDHEHGDGGDAEGTADAATLPRAPPLARTRD